MPRSEHGESDRPYDQVSETMLRYSIVTSDSRSSSSSLSVNSSKEYPTQTKILAWAALCFVQIFASVVLKLAQKGGVYNFSPQSSLVMSEAIKCTLSCIYLHYDNNKVSTTTQAFRHQTTFKLTLHMMCLAAIYCLNNGLAFWLFARADPGSITLIKSGATIVSAILMYFWRGFRLSLPRWIIIFMQMLGLIIAQYDSCIGRSHLTPLVYAILFLSLFNSSTANVWNEHVIKNFESASLATKNILLYFFGAVFNLTIFLWMRFTSNQTPAFFEGYNFIAMGVVISNAFMGIAMNIVYKYADALVKNIATTTTTVVLLILSAFFFDGRTNMMVFLGATVVMMGTYLYFQLGVTESKMKELQRYNDK